MTPSIVNDLGLIIDIAGALLLFKYGLPADIDRNGHTYRITSEIDHDEVRKGQLYDRRGKAGLVMLVIGFALQLISNHMI